MRMRPPARPQSRPPSSWPLARTAPGAAPHHRRPPVPTYVDPSKRKCGNCGTTKSAGKWRRDREIPDSYLCNKCGMNQRRAQLRLELQQQRAAAEALAGVYEQAQRQHYSAQQLSPSDARSPSLPPLGHPSPLHIHSHPSPSSPGHKSLERSSSFSSVATQDGGVPRLPRHTRSAARPRLAASSRSPAPSSPAYRASSVPCNVCNECLPTIELAACKHRVCGECIPVFIRHSLKAQSIDCPVCARDHPGSPTIAIVPIMRLGEFIDSL
nr:hypothetical protein HK105_003040 [Polyrhizophydium stewartii]